MTKKNTYPDPTPSPTTADPEQDAISALLQAITSAETTEERIDLLIHLSNAYDDSGRTDDALETLFYATELDSTSPSVWNNLGVLCQKTGKREEAREAFACALRYDPENAQALINLGSVSLKLNDPGNAKIYLEQALEITPDHPIAHANLSLVLAIFGRIEEAEESLRLAVLYGFSYADQIQEKIDQMKEIRRKFLEKKEE